MEGQNYNIDDLKAVAANEMVDLSEYEGRKAKIEHVNVIDVESSYNADGTKLPAGQTITSKALKVITEKLGVIKNSLGEEKEIRASELFSLKQKPDKTWGWSTHEKAKLMKFYKRMKISDPNTNPKTLIGKEVVITMRPGEDISWLGFMI
jgi:hypothetical protein